MRYIKNPDLARLLAQLRFTPPRQRHKQLEAAENLLSIIDKNKEYPFDFVCFKITGFHPRNLPIFTPPTGLSEQSLIKGDELIEDLQVFISKLTSLLARPVALQKQKIYTVEQLAQTYNVSTKTIQRWRKRGLLARKFIFEDGKKRFGFAQSDVDKFLKKNPHLIEKAKKFTRLTKPQKQWIIKQARQLATKTNLSRYQIIEKIASQINRAHETVRYTILNYDKAHPDRPVFTPSPGAIGPAQAAQLYKLFKEGHPIKELMKRFNRSKSSIYRIINWQRAKELLAKKIEFIPSDEFFTDQAKQTILAEPITNYLPVAKKNTQPYIPSFKPTNSLSQYLQALKDAPLLNKEQEINLFRRYNYLKYLACLTRTGIHPNRVSSAKLKEIENYLTQAETIKKMIIEANLRLVISIAGKHATNGENLMDLVSEASLSLMQAVEKFDYTRQVRFATYATWVISKDLARKIPTHAIPANRKKAASLATLQRTLTVKDAAHFAAIERARQDLTQVIKNELNEREQYIILNHFGLLGSPIKKTTKTLKQIGDDLGLSKERVRQIELIALAKLRQCLTPQQFELLTS